MLKHFLCLLLFVLCCVLSIWQLHRYHFKKDLLTHYQAQLLLSPQAFNVNHHFEFERVYVRGHYLPQDILISNRFYHDQLGVEVFTPFQIKGVKKLLLVDRGWVKQFNGINDIKDEQKISGYLKSTNEYQFILGKNILAASPIRLQKIDFSDLEKITDHPFFPFLLRLDPQAPHGFIRDWTISVMPPERHLGYALQWLSFAFILLIGYVCLFIREPLCQKKK